MLILITQYNCNSHSREKYLSDILHICDNFITRDKLKIQKLILYNLTFRKDKRQDKCIRTHCYKYYMYLILLRIY